MALAQQSLYRENYKSGYSKAAHIEMSETEQFERMRIQLFSFILAFQLNQIDLDQFLVIYYYILMSHNGRLDQLKGFSQQKISPQDQRLLKIQRKLFSRENQHVGSKGQRQNLKKKILIVDDESYPSPVKFPKGYELSLESPAGEMQRMQLQQIQNQQLQAQIRQYTPKSFRNNHWDESFKSLLKSNEGYRRELLSAYEEKVKMQVEKSHIQKQYINLQYQNEDLIAKNKEMQAKIMGLNKNLAQLKENSKKSLQNMQGDISRLKHELNLCNIDKQQSQKTCQEVAKAFKQKQETLEEKQGQLLVSHDQIQQLKGEITFLMGKINQSQEEYFLLEQKLCSAQQNSDNLGIKLQMAIQQASKNSARLIFKQQEMTELNVRLTQQINDKQLIIDEKMRLINKNQTKIRDLSEKVAYIQQQNLNLRDLNQSLKFLQSQHERLRNLPYIIQELSCKNDKLLKQNAKLRAQKEHFYQMFQKENTLLEEVSKEYEELIRISQAKQVEDKNLFDQQIRILTSKLNELQAQLESSKEASKKLQGQLMEKQNQINYNTQLIQRLQQLTEQKIQIIQKHTSQQKKLKRFAQNKTQQTKQNKKVIVNLTQTLKNQKEKWEQIANTNKSLLQEREKNIEALNRQFLQYKYQRQQKQIQFQRVLKKSQQKLRLNMKQMQLVRQKVSQLQQSQKELQKKCSNLQEVMARCESQSIQLRANVESYQKAQLLHKQQIKRLEQEKKSAKERQLGLSKALALKQAQIEKKSANIQDLLLEIQQMKKIRQNDFVIQQAQTKRKSIEKHKHLQQRLDKYQQCMKLISNELSIYRSNISEIKNFNISILQKLAISLNSPQKYTLLREIQKITQLNNRIHMASSNIEIAIDFIRKLVEEKQSNRSNIIVKERNMYKINKFYNH